MDMTKHILNCTHLLHTERVPAQTHNNAMYLHSSMGPQQISYYSLSARRHPEDGLGYHRKFVIPAASGNAAYQFVYYCIQRMEH